MNESIVTFVAPPLVVADNIESLFVDMIVAWLHSSWAFVDIGMTIDASVAEDKLTW